MGTQLCTSIAGVVIALLAVPNSVAQQGFSLDVRPVAVSSMDDVGRPVHLRLGGADETIRRVGVDENAVAVYDGGAIRRRAVDGMIVHVSVSESGRFVALLVLSDRLAGKSSSLVLELVSSDLGLRYRVPVHHRVDEPFPGISVDDSDGSVALLRHAEGTVAFFSAAGMHLVEHRLTDASHDIERTVLASRADRSGQIAIAVNEPVTERAGSVAASQVRIFTSTGRLAHAFEIPSYTLSSMNMSEDGERIAVGAYDVASGVFRTTFFDKAGTEEYRTDFAAESVEFGAGGTRALISNKRRMAIVEPGAARTVVDYSLPASSDRLLSAVLSSDGNFAALLAGKTTFVDGRFQHAEMRLIEFMRAPSGNFDSKTRSLRGSAETVRADVEEVGIAVALDESTNLFRRP